MGHATSFWQQLSQAGCRSSSRGELGRIHVQGAHLEETSPCLLMLAAQEYPVEPGCKHAQHEKEKHSSDNDVVSVWSMVNQEMLL